MNIILELFVPMACIVAIGSIAANYSWLDASFFQKLSRLVFFLFLPATIFLSITQHPLKKIVNIDFILIYTIGSFVTFLLACLLLKRYIHLKHAEIPLLAMGGSFSNSVYLGFPVLLQLFPSIAVSVLVMAVFIETVILLPFVLAISEYYKQENKSASVLGRLAFLSRITHNPVIVTVLAAIIFSALNMSMPTPLEKTLTMIGSCTTVLALFLVGGTIRWRELAARQSEQSESRVIATVVSSKLILHPLIVWFFVWCWKPLDYNLQISAVLLAMMPTFLSYPVLTSQYGLTRISSSIVAISTPLGILSLSFLLWIAL